MADSLYPVFSIPELDEGEQEEAEEMKAGPLFDYELGDFVLDGQNRVVFVDGRDNFMLWCLKALNTQLGACGAYEGFGIDFDGAQEEPTRDAVQSAMERTITEALTENPATERVRDFSFDWNGSELYIEFVIEPKNWEAFDVNMTVVT